jgi:hypothetical protein
MPAYVVAVTRNASRYLRSAASVTDGARPRLGVGASIPKPVRPLRGAFRRCDTAARLPGLRYWPIFKTLGSGHPYRRTKPLTRRGTRWRHSVVNSIANSTPSGRRLVISLLTASRL